MIDYFSELIKKQEELRRLYHPYDAEYKAIEERIRNYRQQQGWLGQPPHTQRDEVFPTNQ